MSRKRKRQSRGIASDASKASEENEALDIEIVDDVGMLDSVNQPAESQPASSPAVPEPEPEKSPRADALASTTVDASAVSDAAPANNAVHVVEPLHVSPPEDHGGDRNVETLGELLQHAREAKGLSLAEVSARTRIALITLRHLENDRFGELPAEAYVKGFLRSYGVFLGLDVPMLLRRYEKLSGHVSTPVAEIWDEVEVRKPSFKVWTPSRRTVALVTGVLVVAALTWVFWSQGAVMLGLRPKGELQQIEMELQREALDGELPQVPVSGLEGAELQQEAAVAEEKPLTKPPAAAPAKNPPQAVVSEDTAPPLPTVPVPAAPQAGAAADTSPEKPIVTKKPAAKPKTPRKAPPKPAPKKKPAPTPSPEDAAGPPG